MRKRFLFVAPILFVALLSGGCMSHKAMMSDHSMMSSDGSMMMMNSDGTMRAMTDSEMSAHMDMMMKDPRMSQMMMDKMKNDPMMSKMMMDKCKGM